MIRLTHSGEVIDTIPRQLRVSESGLGINDYGLTWSTPYFYLWEGIGSDIYFTRFTEDLTLIDEQPRYLGANHGRVFFGGHQIWTVGAYPGGIWAYDAVTGGELFAGPAVIPGWSSYSGVTFGATISNGAYFYHVNVLDTTSEIAHVAPDGTAHVSASRTGSGYPMGGPFFSGDSAIYWTIGRTYRDTAFVYYFVSPSDSLSPKTLHEVYMPPIPGYYYDDQNRFVTDGNLGLLIGQVHGNTYKNFAPTIDLRADSLLSFQWLDFQRHTFEPPEVALSQDGAVVVKKLQGGLEAIPVSGTNYTSIGENRPVVYGLGYQSWPKILYDSLGLFVYTVNGTPKGAGIVGYHWPSPNAASLAEPERFQLPTLDSGAFFPCPFDYPGGRALFWRQEPPGSTPSNAPLDVEQHVSLYQGVFPTESDITSAVTLETAQRVAVLPPSMARVKDKLYVISHAADYASRLKVIDLNTNTLLPMAKVVYSYASAILFDHADTLVQIGVNYNCLNYECGNIMDCCLFQPNLYNRGYEDTTRLFDFGTAFSDQYVDYMLPYATLSDVQVDGQHYVAYPTR